MDQIRKMCVRLFLLMGIVCSFGFLDGTYLRSQAASSTEATQTKETEKKETKKKGLVKENGSYYYYNSKGNKVKSTWKTINGKKYYFKSNGKAATGGYKIKNTVYVFSSTGKLKTGSKTRFVTVGKYKYRVTKKGVAKTGWFVTGGKLYYAKKTNGRLSSATRSNIKFSKKTYAAKMSNTDAKLKYRTVKIVSDITTSSMSKSKKLKACWDYVVNRNRFSYVRSYSFSFAKGWAKSCAYQLLGQGYGNCRNWACAFAALAYEVGYDPYVVWGYVPSNSGGSTRHAWVKIKINGSWKYYDPEGQWAGWNTGQYGTSYYNAQRSVTATYRYKTS